MTSIFGANGKYVPCTVVEAGPCVVTQVKTKEKDGYEALQLAFDEKKEKNTSKSMQGHFKKRILRRNESLLNLMILKEKKCR